MAYLFSRLIQKLGNIQFIKCPPRRVANAKRVYREGDMLLIEMSNGTFLPARVGHPVANVGQWATYNHKWIIDGLAAFGVITKEEQAAHNDEIAKRYEESVKKWDADALKKLAENHKFKLTAQQKRVMNIE